MLHQIPFEQLPAVAQFTRIELMQLATVIQTDGGDCLVRKITSRKDAGVMLFTIEAIAPLNSAGQIPGVCSVVVNWHTITLTDVR